MKSYLKENVATPQSEPLPGQVANSAGGFSFAVSKWDRLRRFLILGSEGGTYYVSERKLTRENITALGECIAEDGARTVMEIVAISKAGRASKPDPALFALAMCASADDVETRHAALNALTDVARTGTHLFHFLDFLKAMRGWSRQLRTAVAEWYTDQPIDKVALQAVKYRQRDGWTHRDVLRLSHAQPQSGDQNALFAWIVGKVDVGNVGDMPRIVEGYERAQTGSVKELPALITEYRLPREAIPSEALNSVEVWEALLEDMPMTAMIRNLANMTRIGLLKSLSDSTRKVIDQLGDKDRLRKSRIHPLAVLTALMTYRAGHGVRGANTWQPVGSIVDALDQAFYASFGNVKPTGKATALALDTSGSMTGAYFGGVAGIPGFTPAMAGAAMALVTANVESNYVVLGFDTSIREVTISPRMRLDTVLNAMWFRGGGTDTSLPIEWAIREKAKVETFAIYTDSETWAGRRHLPDVLRDYRKRSGIPARLVVVGMTSNGFTIADPKDAGMLDVVGFDSGAPQLISDFSAGRL